MKRYLKCCAFNYLSFFQYSIHGWIFISVAIFLILAGLIWFRFSQLEFQRIQALREKSKLKKVHNILYKARTPSRNFVWGYEVKLKGSH